MVLGLDEGVDFGGEGGEGLVGAEAVVALFAVAVFNALHEPGLADFDVFVEVGTGDGKKLDPFEERIGGILGLFKDTADGETGHAHGHLDFLKQAGDPATGLPIGNTEKNLKSAVHGETHEYETMYPGMAKEARTEGFDDIADWFETLAKAEKSHAGRFAKALAALDF